MADAVDQAPNAGALLRLLTWLSPAFPTGAFAYSHGLEAAVAEGQVPNGEALGEWIETLLLHGSGWNDLVFFAEAHRLARAGNEPAFHELAALARASAGGAERRMETLDLGLAFAQASAPWSHSADAFPAGAALPYPVAVGTLAGREGVPLEAVLLAFAHAFASNLTSAAVRLVPLGQRDAVGTLKRLEPTVTEAARRAGRSTLDDLGSCAILSDIAALRHETLATRLFRS